MTALYMTGACGGTSPAESTRTAPEPRATTAAESSLASTVPPEFAAACSHPGATVTTDASHLVIRHQDCDLSGVIIVKDGSGITVPGPNDEAGGVSSGTGVQVTVDARTRDVTFTANAPQ